MSDTIINNLSESTRLSPTIFYNQRAGELHIRVGPMFSGKTVYLNAQLTNWADGPHNVNVLRIGHSMDIRKTAGFDAKNNITSHSSSFATLSSKINTKSTDDLDKIDIENFDIIGIDEAQWFKELAKTVINWLNQGKIIYISSLDAYSNGNVCGEATQLIGYCSTFKKLTADCVYCSELSHRRPAIITASRIKKNGNIHVGGSAEYAPACLNCHSQYNIN